MSESEQEVDRPGVSQSTAVLIRKTFDTRARLPALPFLTELGHVVVCEFSDVLSGYFEPVLSALVGSSSDRYLEVAILDPGDAYYSEVGAGSPVFKVEGTALARQYVERMLHAPGGNEAQTFSTTAEVIAIAGSSGEWAVWAERDWEIGVIATSRALPPDFMANEYLLDAMEDFSAFRGPVGWSIELTDEVLDEFRRGVQNLKERASRG